MLPKSPVIKGFEDLEIIIVKDQPEYLSLPSIFLGDKVGTIINRWKLTWKERIRIFLKGDLYLEIMTFNHFLLPIRPSVEAPEIKRVEGNTSTIFNKIKFK